MAARKMEKKTLSTSGKVFSPLPTSWPPYQKASAYTAGRWGGAGWFVISGLVSGNGSLGSDLADQPCRCRFHALRMAENKRVASCPKQRTKHRELGEGKAEARGVGAAPRLLGGLLQLLSVQLRHLGMDCREWCTGQGSWGCQDNNRRCCWVERRAGLVAKRTHRTHRTHARQAAVGRNRSRRRGLTPED